MKFFKTMFATAALALGLAAVPAAAQAQSIAVINQPVAVAGVTALQTAYNQIGEQYSAQIQSLQQLAQQRNDLLTQLDTNNDGNLDEAEQQAAANAPQAAQIRQIDQQVGTIETQINTARAYAVEQVLQQYSPALQQLVSERQIQVILPTDAVIYAAQSNNLTQAMAQALNTRVTAVNIAVPANWQPTNRSVVSVMQQVSQVYAVASAQQQQQQQPAQQQPQGR